MAKVTGNVDLFAELFPWTPDDMADPFLTSNPVPVPAAAMETELIPCTRLQVLLGERAYENLRRYYGFEEAELTKRGQKMWRNGEWKFAAFCLSIRNMIAWLGDGILVDGTRRGLTDGAYFSENTHGFNLLVHLWTHPDDDQLEIWAAPETTLATQTTVCDLLLQGFTTGRNTTKMIVLRAARNTAQNHCIFDCPFSGPAFRDS